MGKAVWLKEVGKDLGEGWEVDLGEGWEVQLSRSTVSLNIDEQV